MEKKNITSSSLHSSKQAVTNYENSGESGIHPPPPQPHCHCFHWTYNSSQRLWRPPKSSPSPGPSICVMPTTDHVTCSDTSEAPASAAVLPKAGSTSEPRAELIQLHVSWRHPRQVCVGLGSDFTDLKVSRLGGPDLQRSPELAPVQCRQGQLQTLLTLRALEPLPWPFPRQERLPFLDYKVNPHSSLNIYRNVSSFMALSQIRVLVPSICH